jgi:hypothetical protein
MVLRIETREEQTNSIRESIRVTLAVGFDYLELACLYRAARIET